MKRLTFIFFSCFCLLSQARVLKVGPAQKYSSIRSAILASDGGDTIMVEPGLYKEKNLIIGKPVTLIGIHFPILDGEHQYEILSLKSNHITVSGFKVIHSGVSSLNDIAGIKIYNAREVTITNNILEDDFFGIYAQAGTKCRIENNDIKAYSKSEQQSGNGIHCWKCDSMMIRKNKISGHRDGIYFEFVTNSVIEWNVSTDNLRYGLHFMFSHHDDYVSNIFRNNGAGVSVMFTHGVKMLNNRFENNWGDGSFGLLLKEMSDSYISGNKFGNNTAGIYMEGATRIQIEKNLFQGNGWALKIQASCMDVQVTKNNFISNTFDIATNGTLVLNSFNYNYWDKYDGYDLNKDHIGDIPFHPVSLFSMVVEKNPSAMMLFRSFMTTLLDKTEKIVPSLTPENLKDDYPLMKPIQL